VCVLDVWMGGVEKKDEELRGGNQGSFCRRQLVAGG